MPLCRQYGFPCFSECSLHGFGGECPFNVPIDEQVPLPLIELCPRVEDAFEHPL